MTVGYRFLLLDNPPESKITQVPPQVFFRDQQKTLSSFNKDSKQSSRSHHLQQQHYPKVRVPKFKLPQIDLDNPIYLADEQSSYRTFGSLSMRTARRNKLRDTQPFHLTQRTSDGYRSRSTRIGGKEKNRMSRSLVDSKNDIQNELSQEDTYKYSSSNFSKMRPKFNLTGSRMSGFSTKEFPSLGGGKTHLANSAQDSSGFHMSAKNQYFFSRTRNSVIGESDNEQSLEAVVNFSDHKDQKTQKIALVETSEAENNHKRDINFDPSSTRGSSREKRISRRDSKGIENAFSIIVDSLI